MTNSTPETSPKKRKRPIILSILLIIWTIIKTVFVTYAVLFTLAATFLIIKGYYYFNDTLMKPVNEVKALIAENPAQSAYMSRYRQELREKKENDSLTIKFVPLDSISKTLIYAALAVEDDGFYNHPGFSLDAIVDGRYGWTSWCGTNCRGPAPSPSSSPVTCFSHKKRASHEKSRNFSSPYAWKTS